MAKKNNDIRQGPTRVKLVKPLERKGKVLPIGTEFDVTREYFKELLNSGHIRDKNYSKVKPKK